MNRQILFRGKTSKGEWVFGDLIQDMSDWYAILPIECQKISLDSCIDVIPETVGQFTGLIDKNGVKIFEGDKVDIIHPCWTATCETKFIDGAFFFCEDGGLGSYVREDKFLKQKWKIEVIGNIHDK